MHPGTNPVPHQRIWGENPPFQNIPSSSTARRGSSDEVQKRGTDIFGFENKNSNLRSEKGREERIKLESMNKKNMAC